MRPMKVVVGLFMSEAEATEVFNQLKDKNTSESFAKMFEGADGYGVVIESNRDFTTEVEYQRFKEKVLETFGITIPDHFYNRRRQ